MSEELTPTLPVIEEEDHQVVKQDYLPLYKILMWDDSVTTMEFVIRMLMKVFGKSYDESERLMYEVHYSGVAHVDTQPLERAEFKVEQVHMAAAMEEFPFKCTIEPY
jgi:ATP-dependent Clp protease adaptor protein ClpS